MAEEKEIYVMEIGLLRNEDDHEPIPLREMKLLINGAILTFEWKRIETKNSRGRTRGETFGFKVTINNVEGPFGVLDELSDDE